VHFLVGKITIRNSMSDAPKQQTGGARMAAWTFGIACDLHETGAADIDQD
jgi:hypothetical protein